MLLLLLLLLLLLQAETLSKHTLLLALCDREQLRSKDEFFVQDLIGMKAYLAGTGQLLGMVTEIYDRTGTYDTLRLRLVPTEADITKSQYRTVLVPFVDQIVPDVDKKAKQLTVDPPKGLLSPEVVTVRTLKKPYTPEQQQKLLQQLKAQQQAEQQRLALQAPQQQQQQQAKQLSSSKPTAAAVAEGQGEEVDAEEEGEEQEEEEEQQRGSALRQKLVTRRRALLRAKQAKR